MAGMPRPFGRVGGPNQSMVASVPSENWDDDFEFGQSNSNTNLSPQKTHPIVSVSRLSPHFSEDWDAGGRSRQPSPKAPVAGSSRASGLGARFDSWAEPGPSTPTKHGTPARTENWDDDFEDKGDSPPGRRPLAQRPFQPNHHVHALRTRHSYHTPPRLKPLSEPENWDDDFDDPMDPTSSTSPSKTENDNTPVTKRTRREMYADSSDEDEDFGFLDDKEEDKTVTAHSRRAPMLRPSSSGSPSILSSPPPVPPLPHAFSTSLIEPFPRSPTVSVFSIPTTSGRNSVGHFNSTSHLMLSGASSLAMHPPSPPQRERRRLRKKSRPPNMDNNVFELIEEPRDSSPPPLPPSTPERMGASSPPTVPTMLPSPLEATPGSGGSKTPLLSRIGSVKKWNVRRKRASTGPAEVMMQEFSVSSGAVVESDGTPRPPSSLDQVPVQTPSSRNRHPNHAGGLRSGWFFRTGGAHYGAGSPPPGQAELKHERSLDQVQLRPGAGVGGGGQVPTTPSKSIKWSKRKASGLLEYTTSSGELTGGDGSSASGVLGLGKPSLGPNRRPSSMQVPNGTLLAIGPGSGKFGSVGTRHASYGSSVGRASSSRVFSAPTPSESTEDLPPMPALPLQQEGSRGFIGSMRKISLVNGKKHKKRPSIEMPQIPPLPADFLQDDMGDDDGREHELDGDREMEMQRRIHTPDLLPPIELHPPSPPRAINGTHSMSQNISEGIEPMIPSSSAPAAITMSSLVPSTSPVSSNKMIPKIPSSPQSASLGRATQVPNQSPSTTSVPRRNSLGDLKIPARISQAQIGLKRDLGLVREFANSIDRLKELQSTYHNLLSDAQTFLESAPSSRAQSPNVFNLVRPRSRLRSNTSPQSSPNGPSSVPEHKHIATSIQAITVKYKVLWECAELLIELGGGTPTPASPPVPGTSVGLSLAMSTQAELDYRKNRERAVTLSGEESKPPLVATAGGGPTSPLTSGLSDTSWHSSTGRHDLSQRQLMLLRDMLASGELPSDDSHLTEENVNRNWRWGDGMNSTVTLPPSEDSDIRGAEHGEHKKKRRGGRMGLTGLRDMLRMLKRNRSEQVASVPVSAPPAASTVSLSTDSSQYSHHYPHGQIEADGRARQRRPNTSTGESLRSTRETPHSPYGGPPLHHKSSPRRPSLASIFRLGQKNKSTACSSLGGSSQGSRSASRGSSRTEEDWDRIESAIDLDQAARVLGIVDGGTATIKGRKGRATEPFLPEPPPLIPAGQTAMMRRPVTPRHGQHDGLPQVLRLEVEASPRSLRPMRSTRLSNVEEVEDGEQQQHQQRGGGVSRDHKSKHRVSLPRTMTSSTPRPSSRPSTAIPQGSNSGSRTGSVRSVPPVPPPIHDDVNAQLNLNGNHASLPVGLPEIKLSMTPENIKPLLENAKEVHVRCHECIRELRLLLDGVSVPGDDLRPVSAS